MKSLIFIAPPAAGKGTQAELLKEKYHIPHISTGDLLRDISKQETDLGNEIKAIISAGNLINDDQMIRILEDRITKEDCQNGFILDGFPRNINQAKSYELMLEKIGQELGLVIYLDVPKETLMERITGRLSCPNCHAIFNKYYDKFVNEGSCNNCQTELTKRSDDNEETFNNRYNTFISQTKPLIDYYQAKGILYAINDQDKNIVFEKIVKLLEGE